MSSPALFATLLIAAAPAFAQTGTTPGTAAPATGAQTAPAQTQPAPAQTQPQTGQTQPQTVTPPPEFNQAAQAFGQCVGTSASALPATVTPEAGAKQALAGCQAQKTALETRFEAWVTSPGFPEAGRATAREQFRTQIAGVEGQVADRIRAGRAAPTTTAPTTAAPPQPTPSR